VQAGYFRRREHPGRRDTMDGSSTSNVNSTRQCCYDVNGSTLNSHEGTTDDDAVGGPECCRSWPSLLLLILVVAGVTGNTLVCCAVAVERKLRNVTNYFLVSLAVADLLVSVVVMPSCIAHDVIGTAVVYFYTSAKEVMFFAMSVCSFVSRIMHVLENRVSQYSVERWEGLDFGGNSDHITSGLRLR